MAADRPHVPATHEEGNARSRPCAGLEHAKHISTDAVAIVFVADGRNRAADAPEGEPNLSAVYLSLGESAWYRQTRRFQFVSVFRHRSGGSSAMYMSGVSTSPEGEILNELAGARVLITGLSALSGVDLARTFADLKSHLVIQTTDLSPDLTELVALLSQSAADMKLFTDDLSDANAAISFARASAQAFGGLDVVVNLATITRNDMAAMTTDRNVENLVSAKLAPMAYLTQVTANRMRTVFSDGLILNALTMPPPRNGREQAVATMARAALTAMTTLEARAWAEHGIRINAIGPRVVIDDAPAQGAYVSNDPDLAALTLYLASRRGRGLSGHVFDAEGAADAF